MLQIFRIFKYKKEKKQWCPRISHAFHHVRAVICYHTGSARSACSMLDGHKWLDGKHIGKAFKRDNAIQGKSSGNYSNSFRDNHYSLLGIRCKNVATTQQINFRLIKLTTSVGVERRNAIIITIHLDKESFNLFFLQMELDSRQIHAGPNLLR